MTQIIYPYKKVKGDKWGDELKYSLRSLDQNLNGNYHVLVIGDRPDWLKDEYCKEYACRDDRTEDAVHKFLIACLHGDEFLYWHDDMYLHKPVNVEFFKKVRGYPPMTQEYMDAKSRHGSLYVKTLMIPTYRYLESIGKNWYGYETHIPRWYESEKVRQVLIDHKVLANKRLTSTIYYNVFYEEPEAMLQNNEISVGFSGYKSRDSRWSDTLLEIESALRGMKVFYHNDAGLTDALKTYIMGRFPHKSKYEK